MYDIRSHGELAIPDDLTRRQVLFLCLYRPHDEPQPPAKPLFKPLTVGKNKLNRLEAEASVASPKKIHRGEPVEISVKVKGTAGKTLKGTYHLSNEGDVFKEGRLTANSQGYAFVRFNYPNIADDESVRCDIRFDDDKDVAELTLNLRHEGNKFQLQAYPEGGHLLEGMPGRVIIETQDERRNPPQSRYWAVGKRKSGKYNRIRHIRIGGTRIHAQKRS